ncbi:hypothetical protein GCM10022403_050530 [Streptomyces coacervatus]|uniref:DUF4760 domain-containing protein n=1 Tax=Streptomyces coacervatus TaxID=647381 RepID=A0ABP7I771_9ACTN|nr:DUF6082 family protein [Streptomyces coacervatus]MDF2266103.1 DUF6082 family protein [Streptomyces coacervatus]
MSGLRVLKELAAASALVVAACVASILVTVFLVRVPGLQSPQSGNAGQAFGAAAGVTSMIVLVFMVRTFHQQRQETQMQRELLDAQLNEVMSQSEYARINNECAQRMAEAAVREQHQALLSAAIDDPALAAVWPGWGPDISEEKRKQFLYANLIISFHYMAYTVNYTSTDEVEASMFLLFRSDIIREFWERSRESRMMGTATGGAMWKFYEMAELAYQRRRVDGP